MNRAARSILVFGVYVVLLGASLSIAPDFLLGLFGLPAAREIWIRVLGVVVFVLGAYYVQAAREQVTAFFRWTVWGRSVALAAVVALVLGYKAPPVLMLFGAVDAAGALWTALALRAR